MDVRFTHIGAATLLIEVGGLRVITDPVLDQVGAHYSIPTWIPRGVDSTKTASPAVEAGDLGRLDAVLLSHEHHFDNLDESGRRLLPGAGAVLTTRAGAKKLGGNAIGLRPGEAHQVGPEGSGLKVTATPARHGPGLIGMLAGPVIGFLLEWEIEDRRWWISGDTRWFGGLRSALSECGQIDLAVVHVGGARFWPTGPARYTMEAKEAATMVREIGAEAVIPIHYEGWTHFKQGRAAVEEEFRAGGLADRVRWLEIGRATELSL